MPAAEAGAQNARSRVGIRQRPGFFGAEGIPPAIRQPPITRSKLARPPAGQRREYNAERDCSQRTQVERAANRIGRTGARSPLGQPIYIGAVQHRRIALAAIKN